jgi:FO synthase
VRSALAKASDGIPLDDDDALALFQAEGPGLDALARVADALRRDEVG